LMCLEPLRIESLRQPEGSLCLEARSYFLESRVLRGGWLVGWHDMCCDLCGIVRGSAEGRMNHEAVRWHWSTHRDMQVAVHSGRSRPSIREKVAVAPSVRSKACVE